jgi:hypothetical protein
VQRYAIVIREWCGGTSRKKSPIESNNCECIRLWTPSLAYMYLTCYTMLCGLNWLEESGHAWVVRGVLVQCARAREMFWPCRKITCMLNQAENPLVCDIVQLYML